MCSGVWGPAVQHRLAIDWANLFPANTGCRKTIHSNPSRQAIVFSRWGRAPAGRRQQLLLAAITAASDNHRQHPACWLYQSWSMKLGYIQPAHTRFESQPLPAEPSEIRTVYVWPALLEKALSVTKMNLIFMVIKLCTHSILYNMQPTVTGFPKYCKVFKSGSSTQNQKYPWQFPYFPDSLL